MKILRILLIIIAILTLAYFLGPKEPIPTIGSAPEPKYKSLEVAEKYVNALNKHPKKVRQGCEAEIKWYNNKKQKTKYSIVYLHGYSACKEEGKPLHYNIAKKYGMNMYLPRLYNHGITGSDTFNDMNADSLIHSAKKAIAIGKTIGDQVIVIGTSAGGVLSMYLTPDDDNVIAQILLSPSLKLYDDSAQILNGHWGVQIGEKVNDGEYLADEKVSDYKKKYWSIRMKVKTAATLQALISNTISDKLYTKTFKPLFVAYYYKNEKESDDVISTEEIKRMFTLVSTPANKKNSMVLKDANNHVISNPHRSNPASVKLLEQNIHNWIDNTLNISPVQ